MRTGRKQGRISQRPSRSYRLIGKSRSIWQIPVSGTQGSGSSSTLAGTYLIAGNFVRIGLRQRCDWPQGIARVPVPHMKSRTLIFESSPKFQTMTLLSFFLFSPSPPPSTLPFYATNGEICASSFSQAFAIFLRGVAGTTSHVRNSEKLPTGPRLAWPHQPDRRRFLRG